MSEPEQPVPFAAGFMDDYFAEADEHLVSIRRDLLALEGAIGGELPAVVLEDLFRRFHSLKGISAMVELRQAEVLAHQMEGCLRAIRERELMPTAATMQTLVDGVAALDAVIAARRTGSAAVPPLESLGPVLDRLAVASVASKSVLQDDLPTGSRPLAAGRLWRVMFVPAPALVQRGITVDAIRTKLIELGRVISVTPKVLIAGGISFEFQVETGDEAQLSALRGDGVSYEPLSVPLPDASATAAGTADRSSRTDARESGMPVSPANFVRVDLARLDELMRLVGDLVVARARLDDTVERIERYVPPSEWRELQEHVSGIERHLRGLREGVMRVRLVPVAEIFRRMPFVVRDLARDHDKRLRLELEGQSTEIDKYLIERMMDPMLHLVRNAVSHGIETPADRIARGKSPEGTIWLRASTAGESVVIEVADDGAGIDEHMVAARARQAGLPVDTDRIGDRRVLLDVISASGFSTRDEADRASGRGVGMAVVRNSIRELGGTLSVETSAGRGTTFRMTLPLTLAITDAIIAHVGDRTFAVPQAAVREAIEVDPAAIRAVERHELIVYRGGTLPIVRLGQLFGIPVRPRPRLHALVVGVGFGALGLIVDRIAGQQEIVVKTMTDPLVRVDGVSGATELGDGRLVLMLDPSALGRGRRPQESTAGVPA